LFGPERVGLSNDDLGQCQWLIRIPANPAYESLNLAMAVQIICYELYAARGARVPADERDVPLASAEEMQRFYEHLEQVMNEAGFTDRTESGAHS
jgi:tRNA C32,U32 (ribose-2'-O)-methylase TrmJ